MVFEAFAQGVIAYALRFGPLPGTRLISWLQAWAWIPAIALIAAALMVFPTGRAANAFWAWVTRAACVVAVIAFPVAIPMFSAPASELWGRLNVDPSTIKGGAATSVMGIGATLLIPLALVAVAHRYVRSRGIERLQMKWLVYGAAMLAVGVVAATFGDIEQPAAAAAMTIGVIAIPLNATLAITRYRLFEIDRVVSRTVTYAVVTAVLAVVFSMVALVPTIVVGRTGSSPDWLISLGTLAAAALARPVLHRVRRAVDRRFNRSRYDAALILDQVATRLRDEVDMRTLVDELEATVRRTLQPSSLSTWIRASG